jgi:CRP-like cAMP-binding protein
VPVQFTVQAVTNGHAFSITATALQRLYDTSKTWERLGRLINQYYLMQLINRNNSMHKTLAKQRYEEMQLNAPHLFNLVPLKHIASYLGITLETLSRLKSNKY